MAPKTEDELREEEEIRRGREARAVLENPLVRGALTAIRDHALKEIIDSDPANAAGREVSYRLMRTAMTFEKLLTRFVETGSLAEVQRDIRDHQRRSIESD